ncbi:DUF3509 domain-containing protein [Pseudomonas boanensis]|uniref:DUF3509 domain-containing protein n=1 Tax=Metapseudomonas boanensis TaxID=2822138 RepID=A0ABS5XHL5_9GAMM|nr:DUF3509 domain-containing protein [Pseudomonas boanensis]MBT8766550.1 DUF3509 domain-containing protein [Pseudomonas boanensis]
MNLDIGTLANAFPDYELSTAPRPDGGYVLTLEREGKSFQRVVPRIGAAAQLDWLISTLKRDLALEFGEVPPVESLKVLHRKPLPRYLRA